MKRRGFFAALAAVAVAPFVPKPKPSAIAGHTFEWRPHVGIERGCERVVPLVRSDTIKATIRLDGKRLADVFAKAMAEMLDVDARRRDVLASRL